MAARSTPTCVGTSLVAFLAWLVVQVHPHVRGDVDNPHAVPRPGRGPPPRAWGRPIRSSGRASTIRSTPTCVGTSGRRHRPSVGNQVHPHVRGDVRFGHRHQLIRGGPPPRAWGRHSTGVGDVKSLRSTPTCVGTSATRCGHRWRARVHPHVRGDVSFGRRGRRYVSGPPPRAWGRLAERPRGLHRHWSTPTCVGTSVILSEISRPNTVHPHVRGDVVGRRGRLCRGSGPPPRAWGRLKLRGR